MRPTKLLGPISRDGTSGLVGDAGLLIGIDSRCICSKLEAVGTLVPGPIEMISFRALYRDLVVPLLV